MKVCSVCKKANDDIYRCDRCGAYICYNCWVSELYDNDAIVSDMIWNEGYINGKLCPDCYKMVWAKLRELADELIFGNKENDNAKK